MAEAEQTRDEARAFDIELVCVHLIERSQARVRTKPEKYFLFENLRGQWVRLLTFWVLGPPCPPALVLPVDRRPPVTATISV